jgi:glycosyltransferase involved in cell wall biosynthesis
MHKLFHSEDFSIPTPEVWPPCGRGAMRIAIDIRPFLSRSTGVGVLFENLLAELAVIDRTNHYLLFSSSLKQRPPDGLFAVCDNFRVLDHRFPVRLLNHVWHNYNFPPVELFVGRVDVAHSPHPLLLPSRRARRVVTIHDLHFLQRPDQVSGEIRRDYPRLVRKSAERADLVQTVSGFTRDAIVSLLGIPQEKIRIVGPGVAPPENPAGLRRLPLPGLNAGDYLAFVGTLEPRKNVPLLIRAYARLVEELGSAAPLRLALAGGGRPEYVRELKTLAKELGILHRVVFLGYCSRKDIWRFYAGAAALVITSSVEGFCIPLLEAMAAGTPVVAVATSAIPEVAGDAALLVEEGDLEGLSGALVEVLADGELRDRLVRRGRDRSRMFTWEASAKKLLGLYRELDSESPGGGSR